MLLKEMVFMLMASKGGFVTPADGLSVGRTRKANKLESKNGSGAGLVKVIPSGNYPLKVATVELSFTG